MLSHILPGERRGVSPPVLLNREPGTGGLTLAERTGGLTLAERTGGLTLAERTGGLTPRRSPGVMLP